jgi:uncharacterized protein (DUF1697 family)
MRYAALLRAVNLVKRNRLAMADLREILTVLGYEDVITHLQSGNGVFTSELPPATLERHVAGALAEHAGLNCAVMVRSGPELAAVVAANPLGRNPDNPTRFIVSFLADMPEAAAVAEFAELDLGAEQAWIVGREVYYWFPDGRQGGKLSNTFLERRLGVAGTARNWNTVSKLAELTAS